MGYAESKASIKSLPEGGVPMDQKASKMSSPGIRLNISSVFHGYISDPKKFHEAYYYPYFVLSQQDENIRRLRVFSSFYLDTFKYEVPCYNHQIKTQKAHDKQLIECVCNFISEGKEYTLNSKFELSSAIDSLVGLEFKAVSISVSEKDNSSAPIEGMLYQSISQRIRGLFTHNVRKQDGSSGSLALKYRMFAKLIEY